MTVTIGRRELLVALGGATAWPLAARAQQPRRMRRIGVLTPFPADDAEGHARLTAFAQAVQQSGWTVGQNVRMTIAGALAIPQLCASMQPNWSRLSRTSSWPLPPPPSGHCWRQAAPSQSCS